MNIIITGGRHHADRAVVWNWLDQLWDYDQVAIRKRMATQPLDIVEAETQRMLNGGKPLCDFTIVQGGATGVDKWAREWCMTRGVAFKNYPYPKYLGKSGGPIRNRDMAVKEKPEFVVSFAGGKGTRSMCRIARELGIPVVVAEESPVVGIPSHQFQPRYVTKDF